MSFTMVTHYCMGMKLKSKIAVGHDKLGCGMDMDHDSHEDGDAENHCCDNEYLTVEVADDYQPNTTEYALDVPLAAAILFTYFYFEPRVPEKPLIPADVSPPPQHQDRQILYQTFLI